MSDASRQQLEEIPPIGELVDVANTPLRLRVRADLIFKFMLRFPQVLSADPRVLQQPKAEGATSAELQRIFSLYLSIRNWIQRDGLGDTYPERRCLKLITESIESNHIAKKIFDYCPQQGDIQRMNPRDLERFVPLFDDFEARFFAQMCDVIRTNLEVFGFTQSVVYDPRVVTIPRGAAFEDARRLGIIYSQQRCCRRRKRGTHG